MAKRGLNIYRRKMGRAHTPDLVVIFAYTVIQIVRDNMKSDEGEEENSEEDLVDDESIDSEADCEIMDLDGE